MRIEKIGLATLYLGDCREVAPLLERPAAVITDPPYGINFQYDGYDDSRENLKELISWLMPWAKANADRIVILPGITQIYLYPEPDWIMSICWNTTGSFGGFGFTQWMPALLYGKDLKGFGSINGGILKSDVIYFSGMVDNIVNKEKNEHPCPKPLSIMSKIVARMTEEDCCVVDPFMGSATTGVAAVKLNRQFVGVEREPKYFDIACRRIEEAQRQGDLFRDAAE